MEFCPDCGRLLTYKRRNGGIFYCMKCGHKSRSLRTPWHIGTVLQKTFNVAVADKKSLKLRTTPTVNAHCENCEGNKAESWAVSVGSLDVEDITFYRCVSCGRVWRQSE